MIAMHAPDGFLQPRVAIVTAVVSAAFFALAVRRAGRHGDDRRTPLAGITAAFVFAAQMVNFPVVSGTSGHLLGGALAAILLGPWIGTLAVSIVVVVQALLFADGGLTALGCNVLDMAIVPAFAGWALFRLFARLVPGTATGIAVAGGLAAGLSVVLASMAFALQWLFGATAPVPFDTVFTAMVGVHTLIGIGEGVITALALSAVIASRPDLVAGVQDLGATALSRARRIGARRFAVGAVSVAVVIGTVVSQFADSDPDGLERVAGETGFATSGRGHAFASSLFADYATRGVRNETLSLGIAGFTGVALTLCVGSGLVSAARLARRRAG